MRFGDVPTTGRHVVRPVHLVRTAFRSLSLDSLAGADVRGEADLDHWPNSRPWIAKTLSIRIDTPDYSCDVVPSGWVEDGTWSAPVWTASTLRPRGTKPRLPRRRAPGWHRTPDWRGRRTVNPMTRAHTRARAVQVGTLSEPEDYRSRCMQAMPGQWRAASKSGSLRSYTVLKPTRS